MINREELIEAKVCIDMLVAGKHPSTGEKCEEESLLNEVQVCRSLVLASDVMDLVIKNGGKIDSDPSRRKKPFKIEEWEKKLIKVSDEPIGIAAFSNRVTHILDLDMKRIPGLHMTAWLEACGFLKTREWNDERMKVPTKAGEDLGISMVKKSTRDGRDYYKNLYSKEAQEFLVDHLDAIANYQEKRRKAKKYGLDLDDLPVPELGSDEPVDLNSKATLTDEKVEETEKKKTPNKKEKSSKKNTKKN